MVPLVAAEWEMNDALKAKQKYANWENGLYCDLHCLSVPCGAQSCVNLPPEV